MARPTEQTGEGTKVILRRIDQTKKGLLLHPFLFQVPPLDTVQEQYGFTHQDYSTIGLGTFSRPQGRDLRQVSFQTLVYDEKTHWTLLDPNDRLDWDPDPLDMRDDLIDICESGTPFLLIVHQRGYEGGDDANWPATLRQFTVEQRAGEPGTRYLNVAFTEWRDPTVQRRLKGSPRTGPPKGKRHLPATVALHSNGNGTWNGHTFREVTLYDLARFFYGAPGRWRAIANRNGINISGNRPIWDRTHDLPPALKRSQKVVVPRLG